MLLNNAALPTTVLSTLSYYVVSEIYIILSNLALYLAYFTICPSFSQNNTKFEGVFFGGGVPAESCPLLVSLVSDSLLKVLLRQQESRCPGGLEWVLYIPARRAKRESGGCVLCCFRICVGWGMCTG